MVFLIIVYAVTFIKNKDIYSGYEIYLCNLWILIILNKFINSNFSINVRITSELFYYAIANVTIVIISILMFMSKSPNIIKSQKNKVSYSFIDDIRYSTIEVIESARYILLISLSLYCLFLAIKVIEIIPNVLSIILIIIAVLILIYFDKRKKVKQYDIKYKYRFLVIIYEIILLVFLIIIPMMFFSIPIFINIFMVL